MKVKVFQKFLRKKNIDIVVLWGRDGVTEFNIAYFADTYPHSSCRLIIPTKGKPVLYVPKLELSRMQRHAAIKVELLTQKISSTAKVIGYNGNYLTVNELASMRAQFPKARFVDVSSEIVALREVKKREEILRIRTACLLGDRILKSLKKKIKKMKTEQQAARFILDEIARMGLEPSFPPIVAAGANAAQPHHEPGKGKLRGWCIIDMGVRYKGYCSDITRTWFIGTPSPVERAIYAQALLLQKKGIKHAKVGIVASTIDKAIRDGLGPQARNFIHGTGHSVGREIHDPGIGIRANEARILKENNVVTVEPGLYWEGEGGLRIEDTVLVTKRGGIPLTRFTKKFLTI